MACENEMEKTAALKNIDSLPQLSANQIVVYYSDSAIVRTRLEAQKLIKFEDTKKPYTELPEGVTIRFFNRRQQEQSSLKADYAKYNETDKIWEFKGNVLLINQLGDRLTTEQLFVNMDKEEMTSEKYVEINKADGSKLSGADGFRSNLEFTDYEFREVSGEWEY